MFETSMVHIIFAMARNDAPIFLDKATRAAFPRISKLSSRTDYQKVWNPKLGPDAASVGVGFYRRQCSVYG